MKRHSIVKTARSGMMFRIVPPCTVPTWIVVCGGSKPSSNGPSAARRRASRATQAIASPAACTALTPFETSLEWPVRPRIDDFQIEFAFVRHDWLHPGGFPDHAKVRAQAGFIHVLNQAFHTLAADFLVVADEQVERADQVARLKIRHRCKAGGDEALHVATAPREEFAVLPAQCERIAGPGLTIDRHRIDMSAKRQSSGFPRADYGVQIGLVGRRDRR